MGSDDTGKGGRLLVLAGPSCVGKELIHQAARLEVACTSIFMSPLSNSEIRFLAGEEGVSVEKLVTDLMRRKLLRRMRRQKGELSQRDLDEVERRAGSAWAEIGDARHFDWVIPNHDGEDCENWDAFYFPLGDARRALLAMVALLRGVAPPDWVEKGCDFQF